MPISNIIVSDFITEMAASNPEFAALSDAQKIQRINAAFQEISDMANAAGKSDFHNSTLAGATISSGGGSGVDYRSQVFVCSSGGTFIPFTTPISGNYTLVIHEVDGISIDAPLNEQTANGFTAYPPDGQNDVSGIYHAFPVA